jgi:hypothetical protein
MQPKDLKGQGMRKGIRIIGIMFLIASTALLGCAEGAFATGKATIRLIPNGNIRNGEVVRITGSGFPPNLEVAFQLCNPRLTGKELCGSALVGGVVDTTAQGTFPVTRLKMLSSGCPRGKTTRNLCYMEATTALTGADKATVIIHFAPN